MIYMIWLLFLVLFESISYPNSVFTPLLKVSTLKMTPHTKCEIFQNFLKYKMSLKIEVEKV